MTTIVRPLAAIMTAAVVLAGCTPSPSTSPSPSTVATTRPSAGPSPSATAAPSASASSGTLTWTKLGLAENAELTVPLDYEHPSAGLITLAVSRRPAADPARRLGVLLINPGGPGAPAVGFTASSALNTSIPQAVLDRFDVVAWDPRGVGQSGHLACPEDVTSARIESLDPQPATAQALATYRAAFGTMATDCGSAAGNLLRFLSEANTARDMDALRVALGEQTISYLGWSYGTYLGYLYAAMFPSHLRAAVLDGPVDPTLDLVGRDVSQARGFERAFGHFLKLCAATTACPFHGGGNPGKAYDALIARLRRSPEGLTLDAGQAVNGTLTLLYSHDESGLAEALSEADQGNGRLLRNAADGYYAGGALGAYQATICLDVAHPTTTSAIASALTEARAASPRFGPLIALDDEYGCLDWPVQAPAEVPAPTGGLPPILVITGRWDPATPPEGGAALASALGTGVVLSRDGIGHTSGDSATTNSCLRSAIVAYFIDLQPPAANTVCTDPPVSLTP